MYIAFRTISKEDILTDGDGNAADQLPAGSYNYTVSYKYQKYVFNEI